MSAVAGTFLCLALFALSGCSRTAEVLRPTDEGAADAASPIPDASGDAPLEEPGMLASSSLSAGTRHSCATLRGILYCWGDNARGQLGVGDADSRDVPTRVGPRGDWKTPAAGGTHSCAARADGEVYCFGANDIGQLGVAGLTQSAFPVLVPLPDAATQLVTQANHVCVVTAGSELVCWGENIEGEIGQGDPPPFVSQFLPTEVGTDHDWVAAATGQGDTCGLRGSGDLYCWGRNSGSQLGLGGGAPEQIRTPSRVGDRSYVRIRAGQDHSCAIGSDGSLDCWGLNQSGNLGTGDRLAHSSPIQIGSKLDWRELSLDTFHTCAIDSVEHLYCWGRNVEGQLGLGDTNDRLDPTLVPGDGFSAVAVGRFHTCALKADDSVWCTGANDAGQLGLGDTVRRASFTALSLP